MQEFDFALGRGVGLLIAAGGFEDRATSFVRRAKRKTLNVEQGLLLRYESQRADNEPHFLTNLRRLKRLLHGEEPHIADISADRPIRSCDDIRKQIEALAETLTNKSAIVDISGMTHLWALSTMHNCLSCGLRVDIAYTEARTYYPLRSEWRELKRKLRAGDEEPVFRALQSASLKAVHILPDFAGNFRPGRRTCLMIFAGYEPNRVQGLVDDYAPGSLIVLFGKSPHTRFSWRAGLSRDLHKELFSTWYKRDVEVSTLEVQDILDTLEREFSVLRDEYDVAIAPHCSKMQGVAAYLFWRRHPDVQLVFTSPVKFRRDRYSRGEGPTFCYPIGF